MIRFSKNKSDQSFNPRPREGATGHRGERLRIGGFNPRPREGATADSINDYPPRTTPFKIANPTATLINFTEFQII
ncbi:hypothetical protein VDG1235_386 [Verrucomicrobiia bacterium DG1235]|nr:hypothetical protein VDG1235_386 [Verrucomicrobiae bacterium DG1235]